MGDLSCPEKELNRVIKAVYCRG